MTRIERTIVVGAAAVFLIAVTVGVTVWLLGAADTARSPEYKCQQVMRDIEAKRGQLSAAAWNAGYQGCLDSLRGR